MKWDTAQDGQTMFHTTPHFKTNSSQTTAGAKLDTGAETCTILISHFKRHFPTKSTATASSPKVHYCLQREHG